jgi:hypothetical protein
MFTIENDIHFQMKAEMTLRDLGENAARQHSFGLSHSRDLV